MPAAVTVCWLIDRNTPGSYFSTPQVKLIINYDCKYETGWLGDYLPSRLCLTWCFAEDKIKVYIETSHLSQLKFKNNEEITQALKNAPHQYKEWILTKANW